MEKHDLGFIVLGILFSIASWFMNDALKKNDSRHDAHDRHEANLEIHQKSLSRELTDARAAVVDQKFIAVNASIETAKNNVLQRIDGLSDKLDATVKHDAESHIEIKENIQRIFDKLDRTP